MAVDRGHSLLLRHKLSFHALRALPVHLPADLRAVFGKESARRVLGAGRDEEIPERLEIKWSSDGFTRPR